MTRILVACITIVIVVLIALPVYYGVDDEVFVAIVVGIIIYYVILLICSSKKRRLNDSNYKKIRSAPVCKKISYSMNIERLFYISHRVYPLLGLGYGKNTEGLFSTMLLKWLKKDLIAVKDRYIIFKCENDISNFDTENEAELYGMMKSICVDNVLSFPDFEDWCKENYCKLEEWYRNTIDEVEKELIEKGKILKSREERRYDTYSGLLEELIQLSGLKKYLFEFVHKRRKEPITPEMLEDYLIYAQMLGMGKKVMRAFKKLYPETIKQSQYISYENVYFLYTFTSPTYDVIEMNTYYSSNY